VPRISDRAASNRSEDGLGTEAPRPRLIHRRVPPRETVSQAVVQCRPANKKPPLALPQRRPVSGDSDGLCAPKRDRVCDRTNSSAHASSVVPALNNPLAVFLANNFSDMMGPNDNGANRGPAGVGPIVGPRSCQIVRRSRVAADLTAHVPTAPGAGASGRVMISGVKGGAAVMGSSFGTRRKSTYQCHCG
jgi:hypothetical protein